MNDIATRLAEAAVKDAGRPYDAEAERRHQRRLRAMHALGDADPIMMRVLSACIVVFVGVAIFLAIIWAASTVSPERQRDVAGSPMMNLCASYSRWKALAGSKVAEPDPAPNLTRRCAEGP